jgi:regulator of sigma E protease
LDSLTLVLAAFDPAALLNILTVALGLGLVIFFHELGHFAVAKWCDVQVDRFSIGFGPVLFSRKWGETEYALSAIPFGGYVKMLGQDDADPSQLTSDEIAQDPRSYTAKSVPQRIAIISAGVIMNIITGLMFFVLAFRGGVEQYDRQVGTVEVGSPAWLNGIRPDDTLTEINGEPIDDFNDLQRNVVLSSGAVTVGGVHADGQTYRVTMEPTKPDDQRTRRTIGLLPARSLRIAESPEDPTKPAVVPGSPFASIASELKPGDIIRTINGQEVKSYPELESLMVAHRAEDVKVEIERRREGQQPEMVAINVPRQPFRTLGMQMDIGKISAVRPGSPAADSGLKAGDKLTMVDNKKIGDELDPLRLPEFFAERVGQAVPISISREVAGSEPEKLEMTLTPEATPGWVEHPVFRHSPISVTSVGIAYHLIPTVFRVDPSGPAANAEITERDTITDVELILREDIPAEAKETEGLKIAIGEDNWAFAVWQMQLNPVSSVRVSVKTGDDKPVTRELKLVDATDWYVPSDRGLLTEVKTKVLKAENVSEALALGWRHTTGSTKDIYLTLRGLLTSDISPKELQGPINIARVAYHQAGRGLSEFVLFLGLISINLAVINFLPIPVLDGGHMVFLLWEGLARRRPNERVVAAATYCGLFFVLGLMMFVIYQDLFGH